MSGRTDKVKKKKYLLILIGTVVVIALAATVLFGLSRTLDYYACYRCKSKGTSNALRAMGIPIWRQPMTVVRSVTHRKCDHDWRWYFANSQGILFNDEYWDGPAGTEPFAKEFEAH